MNKPLRLPTSYSDAPRSQSNPGGNGGSPAGVALLGGVILLIIVAAAAYFVGREPIDSQVRENAYLRGQLQVLREDRPAVPPATSTPTTTPALSCDSYAGEIGSLQDLITRGKFALATDLANAHLNNRKLPPCPEARQALSDLGYSASLNDLFASRELDGRAALLRWQDVEARADANKVPLTKRWPPLTIVAQAYNAGFWELGRAAFRQAWRDGTADHGDPKATRLYYALLRNWGYSQATATDPAKRQEGLVLLRTADEISRMYGLSAGEAHQDLLRLGGVDLAKLPAADARDPILAAALDKGEK